MYAWRTTWKAKPGRLQDAVALLNDDTGRPPITNATMRAYTTQVSEGELLVFEEVWPSIKAHDQWWAEWRKAPTYDESWAQWDKVVELFQPTEHWQVTEWRF